MADQVSILLQAIDQVSPVLNTIRSGLAGLGGGFDRSGVTSGTNQIGNAVANAGQQIMSVQGDLQRAGGAMAIAGTAMAAPVIAFGVTAAQVAGEFEASMNQVAALSGEMPGRVGSSFDAMREQAMQLGRTTQYSASEAAGAMAFLSAAGFSANETMGALPSTLGLAAATNTDLARTADIASNVMSGYSSVVREAGGDTEVAMRRIASVTAEAFSSANLGTNIEGFGQSMKMVAPLAAGMGIQFEQTAAAIGILGNAGIQGSMAGTQMAMVLQKLSNPVGRTKDRIQELGLEFHNADGSVKDFVGILAELERANVSAADMSALFGEQAKSMIPLLDAGSQAVAEYADQLATAGDRGRLEELAAVQMQGFQGALKTLGSAWEGLQISFMSSGVLDIFSGIISGIAGMVQAFAALPAPVFRVIAVIMGIVGAVGSVMAIMGGLGLAFVTIVGVLAALPVFFGAVGTIVSALGGVFAAVGAVAVSALLPIIAIAAGIAAAAYLIISNWGSIAPILSGVGSAIMGALQPVIGFVQGLIGVLGNYMRGFASGFMEGLAPLRGIFAEVGESFGLAFASIRQALSDVGQAIGAAIAPIRDALAAIGINFGAAGEAGFSFGQMVGGAIAFVVVGVARFIAVIAQAIALFIRFGAAIVSGLAGASSALSGLAAGVMGAAGGVAARLVPIGAAIASALQNPIATILRLFASLPSQIASFIGGIPGMLSGIFSGISAGGGGLVEMVLAPLRGIPSAIASMAGTVRDAVGSLFANIFSGIGGGGGGGIAEVVLGPLRAIPGAIAGMAGTIQGAISALFSGMFSGIGGGGGSGVAEIVLAPLRAIPSAIAGIAGQVQAALSSLFSGAGAQGAIAFAQSILAALGQLPGAVAGIASSFAALGATISTTLGAALAAVGPALTQGLASAFQQAIAVIQQGLSMLQTGVMAAATAIASSLAAALGSVLPMFSAFLPAVQAFIAALMQIVPAATAIGQAMMAAAQVIMSAFQQVIAGCQQAIAAFVRAGAGVNQFASTAQAALSRVVSAISNLVGQVPRITSAFQSMASAVMGVINNLASQMFAAGARIVSQIASGISSGIGAVQSAVSSVASVVRGALPFSPAEWGPLSDLDKTGPALIRTFTQGIEPTPVVRALGDVMGRARRVISEPLEPNIIGPDPAIASQATAPTAPRLPELQVSFGGPAIDLSQVGDRWTTASTETASVFVEAAETMGDTWAGSSIDVVRTLRRGATGLTRSLGRTGPLGGLLGGGQGLLGGLLNTGILRGNPLGGLMGDLLGSRSPGGSGEWGVSRGPVMDSILQTTTQAPGQITEWGMTRPEFLDDLLGTRSPLPAQLGQLINARREPATALPAPSVPTTTSPLGDIGLSELPELSRVMSPPLVPAGVVTPTVPERIVPDAIAPAAEPSGAMGPITVNLTMAVTVEGGVAGNEQDLRRQFQAILQEGGDLLERKLNEIAADHRRRSYS